MCVPVCVSVQVREHTSHLEAELEKHMAAASAECQNYAKEVAGVSLPPEERSPCPAELRSSLSCFSSALWEQLLLT